MNIKSFAAAALAVAAIAVSCGRQGQEESFYKVDNGRIVKDGVAQYYTGTNMWYASRLALEDRARFEQELDTLAALGVTNIRIKATDENWEGMDIALDEMQERGMSAVLFLNNAWEWTEDAYFSYLEKAGAGKQPHPSIDGYQAYKDAMCEFAANEKAVELFHEHVSRMVERYKDHPAIFSWQVCNEPRPFSYDPDKVDAFVDYIHSTARLIKSIDRNHMVSTGNEGSMGSNEDINLFVRVHDCPDIDYCTIHIWPYNWSWISAETVNEDADKAIGMIGSYMDDHLLRARKLNKPVVIEEFGYPRDGFEYVNTSSTEARDKVYDYVFGRVLESAKKGGLLAGCNFWAWSGSAKQTPGHQFWEEGDDLCGDPFQEAQGLNSVYIGDSTIDIIKKYHHKLSGCVSIFGTDQSKWLHIGDDPFELEVAVSCPGEAKGVLSMALVRDVTLMYERDTVYSTSNNIELNGSAQKVVYDLGKLEPGFYQVNLSLEKEHGPEGMKNCEPVTFNIGVNPEQIDSPQDKPEDFDEFWAEALSELAQVPYEITLTEVPEHSNELRKTYTVEYKSLGGVTVGGVLCEPVAPGKYRTFVDYMGYSCPESWYDPSADPDVVEFQASVRGQGLFLDSEGCWIDRGLGNKDNYYYRGAFCDVVRAIDFILGRENVDPDHFFVRGESQGGALTWIAASLDHRVKAIAPAVPFLSDYKDYGGIVWWPVWEVYQHAEEAGLSREEALDMMRYFDVKNFTDKVECPVLMAFGLQDPTCPPHTNFAGFNQVKAEKDWYCVPTCGHEMWNEKEWPVIRKAFFDKY